MVRPFMSKTRKLEQKEFQEILDKLEEYRRKIYEYNKLVSGKGFRLKPLHIVVKKQNNTTVKYLYFGRYWYKVVYVGRSGKTSKVKWIYLGKEKPDNTLPDPPKHPLEGIVVKIDDTGVYLISSRQV